MYNVCCFEVDKLCGNLPSVNLSDQPVPEFEGLNLAQSYSSSDGGTVDVLIGLDFYHNFVTGRSIRSEVSSLIAMETVFGWSIVGCCEQSSNVLHVGFVQTLSDADYVESIVKKNILLWEGSDDAEHVEASKSLDMVRLADGRYEIKWPWRMLPESMEANDKVAYRRFMVTSSKMAKNPEAFKAYDGYFRDQMALDFIEKAPKIASGPVRYVPHQAVIRQDAQKTKLRVVMDSSCKDSKQLCLNDFIDKGPNTIVRLP